MARSTARLCSHGLIVGFAAWLLFLAAPAAQADKAHRRAQVERHALLRALKHDPRVFEKRWFIRRARAAALDLPLTVRLNPVIDTDVGTPGIQGGELASDDTLQIEPGGGPGALTPPFGEYSGVQDVPITGRFSLTGLFSRDSIAYGPSVLLLGAGSVSMTAEPFRLLDFSPTCSPSADPLLRAGPSTIIAAPPLPARDRRGGTLGWFSGRVSVKLYTQVRFNSQRRGTFDNLGAFTDDCLGSYFWTRAITSTSSPIVPIQMDGHFDVSPAITTDGRLRLFNLTFDDATDSQTALGATLHSCAVATTTPGTDPVPTAPCDGVANDDTALSATIKVKHLTAEVLIGDA